MGCGASKAHSVVALGPQEQLLVEGKGYQKESGDAVDGSENVRQPVEVEEKFPQENFRVISEMRILVKIRVSILDFVGYVEILAKFGAKSEFKV